MNKIKLMVRTTSENVWWGIYGFCEKIGWEDLIIFNDKNEKVAAFCLNTKVYMREAMEDLRDHPSELAFVQAADKYLEDDGIQYWYFYNDPSRDSFSDVLYDAPLSDQGEKPVSIDVWHPDLNISISTIESAVRNFAAKFLGMNDVDIQIVSRRSAEESLQTYKEHVKTFHADSQVEFRFSDDLIQELSVLWGKSKEDTLKELQRAK